MKSRFHSLFVNALTFSRVPLIFAFMAFAVTAEWRQSWVWTIPACVSMFLAGITDLLDGRLARRWNVVSTFGKLADPLMDKVFYAVTLPALAWLSVRRGDPALHSLSILVFAILYIVRDLWVTFLRSVGAMYGADVAAMWIGKVRTALTFPIAGFVYCYLVFAAGSGAAWAGFWLWACLSLEAAMTALNIASFVSYTLAYLPYLKKNINVSQTA
jgi:CDP-diacylglycerol--glycerol-3-phosphate 3-phosphatidyltransferase